MRNEELGMGNWELVVGSVLINSLMIIRIFHKEASERLNLNNPTQGTQCGVKENSTSLGEAESQ